MKIELLTIAPECGPNRLRPAFDNKAHVAQKGFVETRVHGGLFVAPALRPALHFGPGVSSYLSILLA
ncbi:MAG: hypothetical protein NTW28_33500 [Candidatus Solibacter sp.]|nr:hypothetical protein [Candidatus Solibacter sp.]